MIKSQKILKLLGWYSTYEIFFMVFIIFTCYYLYSTMLHVEELKRNSDDVNTNNNQIRNHKVTIIGDGKTISLKLIRPIVPHPAILLHASEHSWTVNVPLTPFKSPLVVYPPSKEPLPKFLLYKPEYLTKPRNQGDCGACWAFSLCGMLADIAMIYSGGVYSVPLSVQELLSCYDESGCDGGSPEDASIWLSETQKPLYADSKFQYKQFTGGQVTTKCPVNISGFKIQIKKNSTKSLAEFVEEKETYSNKEMSIINNNILNMKKALFLNGPFFCALSVYNDLFTYDGLKPYRPQKGASLVGGHGVQIICYCDKGEDSRYDVGYWICKNSWGPNWPLYSEVKGYFMIEMGNNVCGVESRCGYSIPIIYAPKPNKKALPLNQLRYTSFKDYKNK